MDVEPKDRSLIAAAPPPPPPPCSWGARTFIGQGREVPLPCSFLFVRLPPDACWTSLWPHLWHMAMLRPGVKPAPQQ